MSLPKGRYPETERVTSRKDVKRLHEGFGLDVTEDFDDIPEKDMLVLKAVFDGKPCGMAVGTVPPGEDFCRILMVFLSDGFRNTGNTAVLIRNLYCLAHTHPGVKKTVWRYETDKFPQNDPYMTICKRAGITELKDSIISYAFEMDLHDMMKARPKIKTCDEAFVLSKGFGLTRCIEAGDDEKKELAERIERSGAEVRTLSPFDSKNTDEENSFFLTDRQTGQIQGWTICRRADDRTEEIARMYVFPDSRSGLSGLCLGGYVLRRLEGICDRVSVKVLPENIHMLRFMRSFFDRQISERMEKLITMGYPEGDQRLTLFQKNI